MTFRMAEGETSGATPFLRVQEAARFLKVSHKTLERHRSYGTGPKYYKVGARVLYDVEDLIAWVRGGEQTSVSDERAGAISPATLQFAVAPARQREAPED
jgi:hypothetical protein